MFYLKTLQEEIMQNKSLMGLKLWSSWGLGYMNSKITIGRTVFCFLELTSKRSYLRTTFELKYAKYEM